MNARRTAARRRRVPTVVTIAASDSGGGAGVQADLLTIAAHGLHAATVLTAVTAQNTRGVIAIEPVSERVLTLQLDAVFSDLRPVAVKIGVLGDAPRLRRVVAALRRWKARHVVLDPVLAASTGEPLLSPFALTAMRRTLFPLCDLVTPNLPEAEALSGISIGSDGDRRLASRILVDAGARAVLIKGGHGRGAVVCDLFFDGVAFREFRHPRIVTRATHGTGCMLSTAVAAHLAMGRSLPVAVGRAIAYVDAGLRQGFFPGRGWGVPGRFPLPPSAR